MSDDKLPSAPRLDEDFYANLRKSNPSGIPEDPTNPNRMGLGLGRFRNKCREIGLPEGPKSED